MITLDYYGQTFTGATMEEVLEKVNKTPHYKSSTRGVIPVASMHLSHLANAARKQLREWLDKQDFRSGDEETFWSNLALMLIDDPLFVELAEREDPDNFVQLLGGMNVPQATQAINAAFEDAEQDDYEDEMVTTITGRWWLR